MNNETPDEQPKQKLAKKLVSKSRRYFFPQHNTSVKATSLESAIRKVTGDENVKEGSQNE